MLREVAAALREPNAMKALLLIILFACALCVSARGAQRAAVQSRRVAGVVRDTAGAPIGGARVILTAGSPAARRDALTGDDGRFSFDDVTAAEGLLAAEATGFARRAQRWSDSDENAAEVEIVLTPAPVAEKVTVTATRTELKLGETAASVVVLTSETLAGTAAMTLDDALRQVPGFQLFRRTGSRAANPTAQGVSLRGVGASGASRALVLSDGVPLNDPFGGWVYSGRVPRLSIASVEVLRGGASDLYGSAALGGVVNILSRRVTERASVSFEGSYGNQGTLDGSFFAGARKGGWGASLAAEMFHTAGYFLLDRDDRGRVHTPAASRFSALDVTLERDITRDLRLLARGSYYGEARDNGTLMQRNRTHVRQVVVGGDWRHARAGSFTLRAYASSQVFDQGFSAVSADRLSETLTRVQRVPAQAAGFSAQWSRAFGGRHALVAGVEARAVRGTSDELIFAGGRAASKVGAGGRERTAGFFVEDIIRISPKLILTAGVRLDSWRIYKALSVTSPVAGLTPAVVETFPDRAESAVSPRASLLYSPGVGLSFHASAHLAFRAPTLNELYRDFRVGKILTLANENLRAERLTGGDAGAGFVSPSRRLSARATVFALSISRPVTNVTLDETPALVVRQRQNLGRTRSVGLEADADFRVTDRGCCRAATNWRTPPLCGSRRTRLWKDIAYHKYRGTA